VNQLEKVDRWLSENGMTQDALAEASGVVQQTLNAAMSEKVRGRSRPGFTKDLSAKLANGMGVDLRWFLDDSQGWPPIYNNTPGVVLSPEQKRVLELAEEANRLAGDPDEAARRLMGFYRPAEVVAPAPLTRRELVVEPVTPGNHDEGREHPAQKKGSRGGGRGA
jgi:transcriptional regulator with XRE-family HTH domain